MVSPHTAAAILRRSLGHREALICLSCIVPATDAHGATSFASLGSIVTRCCAACYAFRRGNFSHGRFQISRCREERHGRVSACSRSSKSSASDIRCTNAGERRFSPPPASTCSYHVTEAPASSTTSHIVAQAPRNPSARGATSRALKALRQFIRRARSANRREPGFIRSAPVVQGL